MNLRFFLDHGLCLLGELLHLDRFLLVLLFDILGMQNEGVKYSIKFKPTNPEPPVINILLILKHYNELSRLAYFDTTTFLE